MFFFPSNNLLNSSHLDLLYIELNNPGHGFPYPFEKKNRDRYCSVLTRALQGTLRPVEKVQISHSVFIV